MLHPDATTLVVEFLSDRLDDPVSSLVPRDRSVGSRLVTVTRTGGPALNRVVDKPMLLIHAWGSSTVDASELAQSARQILLDELARDHPLVRSVSEVAGLYYSPDPESEQDRFGFSVSLTTRAS